MSENDSATETSPPAVPPRAPPPRRGIAAALALLLSLLALAGVLFGGWHLWRLEQGRAAGSAAVAQLRTRLDAIDGRVGRIDDQRRQLQQQLADVSNVNRSLREQLVSLNDRARNLEDAVANLSRRTLSGHDDMLLDEAELLMRLGQARYTLFHDAEGAAQAYRQAGAALASVDDPAFAGVHQAVEDESRALAAAQPQAREATLAALADLRERLPTLPLKSLDHAAGPAPKGFWARAGRALSGLVRVHRDSDEPLTVADGRLARELAVLDLAQAQAALLAGDATAWHAALQRADTTLRDNFEAGAAPVQAARHELAAWLKQSPATTVKLGAALSELRNLRQVQQAKPAAPSKPATGSQP